MYMHMMMAFQQIFTCHIPITPLSKGSLKTRIFYGLLVGWPWGGGGGCRVSPLGPERKQMWKSWPILGLEIWFFDTQNKFNSFWGVLKCIFYVLYKLRLCYSAIRPFRQHCRLTICIKLVELTNSISIRWQDPNNNTDTETRCLV